MDVPSDKVSVLRPNPRQYLQPESPLHSTVPSGQRGYTEPESGYTEPGRGYTEPESRYTEPESRERNMAPQVFILLIMVLVFDASQAKLEVIAEPNNIIAKPGEKVQLKCALTGIKGPVVLKDYMVQWFTRGKQVAEFDTKIVIDKPGLSLSLEALQKGDATLTIESVTSENAGNYRCYVYYASDHVMKQIVLSVDDPTKPKEEEHELTTCDSILDKKLDKVIGWFNTLEAKLEDLSKKCSSAQRQTKSNK